jgi:hypothetical protein
MRQPFGGPGFTGGSSGSGDSDPGSGSDSGDSDSDSDDDDGGGGGGPGIPGGNDSRAGAGGGSGGGGGGGDDDDDDDSGGDGNFPGSNDSRAGPGRGRSGDDDDGSSGAGGGGGRIIPTPGGGGGGGSSSPGGPGPDIGGGLDDEIQNPPEPEPEPEPPDISESEIESGVSESVAQQSDRLDDDNISVDVTGDQLEVETEQTRTIEGDRVRDRLREAVASESEFLNSTDVEIEQSNQGFTARAETGGEVITSEATLDTVSQQLPGSAEGTAVRFADGDFEVTAEQRQSLDVDEAVRVGDQQLQESETGDGFDVVGEGDSDADDSGTDTDQNSENINVEERREEFRSEAANEFGVDEQDVEVTAETVPDPNSPTGSSVQFEAEQELTDSQRFADGLTGGKVSGLVETGQRSRQSAAEQIRPALNTASAVVTAPAQAAGETFSGAVEIPSQITDAADSAGELASDAEQRFTEAVQPARDSADSVEDSVTVDARDAGQNISAPLASGGRNATVSQNNTSTGEPVTDFVDGDIGAEDVAAAGAAGVVTPEPITSVAGAGLVAGAGAVVAANEINDRLQSGEIEAPDEREEFTQTEIEVPSERQPTSTSEIDAPESRTPTFGSEINTPTEAESFGVAEIDVPTERQSTVPGEIDVPSVTTSGLIERPLERRDESQERVVLDEDTIADEGQTSVLNERERLQQIRDNLERRQQANRDNELDGLTENPDAFDFVGDPASTESEVDRGQELSESRNTNTGLRPNTDIGLTPVGRQDTAQDIVSDQVADQIQLQELDVQTAQIARTNSVTATPTLGNPTETQTGQAAPVESATPTANLSQQLRPRPTRPRVDLDEEDDDEDDPNPLGFVGDRAVEARLDPVELDDV